MIRSICFTLALFSFSSWTSAQDCPGPMRLVVGLPPGGGADIMARSLSERVKAQTGRDVIVDNKPGAGGNIAASIVAKAPPDGCTLLLTGNWHNINALIYPQPGYQVTEFAPVIRPAELASVLVVNPQQPFKTVAELVEYAKANPGKLSYATAGVGSANHMAMELFLKSARIQMLHIPYKGSAPAVADLLGGTVPVGVLGAPSAQPSVASGRLRALVVTSTARLPGMPNVPTAVEAGYPDVKYMVWNGILAPAATPLPLREKLNAQFHAAFADEAVSAKMRTQGYELLNGNVAEFGRFLEEDFRVTQRLVQEIQLKAE